MSCDRGEWALGVAGEEDPEPGARRMLEAHVAMCEECADLISLISALKEAEGAFPSPEPGPQYWVDLGASIDRRLDRPSRGALGPSARLWGWRLALGAAAAGLALVSILVVERGRRQAPSAPAGGNAASWPPPAEAELLARLEKAEPGSLEEALEGIVPRSTFATLEEMEIVYTSIPEELPAEAGNDSEYELFLDLPGESRRPLLKEIHAELG